MLLEQKHYSIGRITDTQITLVKEREYNETTKQFDGDALVTLTGENFMTARGGIVGHVSLKDVAKKLTSENIQNVHVEGSDVAGQLMGFSSAIKGDGTVQVALNPEAIALSNEFRSISIDTQDLGKMEEVNPVTRENGYYAVTCPVRKVKDGTPVRVNGTVLAAKDGFGFAVGMGFNAVKVSMFDGVTWMPANVLSHLHGGTSAHVTEATTGLKQRSAYTRAGAYYDTYAQAYVNLQQGAEQIRAFEVFSDAATLAQYGRELKKGAMDGLLDPKKVDLILNTSTMADKAVRSVAAVRYRQSLTGGIPGVSRVIVPCYDVALDEVGLTDINGGKYIGVRQPVITARNVAALISKRIRLPKHVSQVRIQARRDSKLVSCIKCVVAEVRSVEVQREDGTWELIDQRTLLIGEKEVAIGQIESGDYALEICVVNRWNQLCALNPAWTEMGAQVDFDGDILQLYRTDLSKSPYHALPETWNLVKANFDAIQPDHKKVAKVKRAWSAMWREDFITHIGFAVDCGEMMGAYDMAIEFLAMFSGNAADEMADLLYPGWSADELRLECARGYQMALDARKRYTDEFDGCRKMARQIAARFRKVQMGHIKSDPAKYKNGWFAVTEPTMEEIADAYSDQVRADYLPLLVLRTAMERDDAGKFINWHQMSQCASPTTMCDLIHGVLGSQWSPKKAVQTMVFCMMRHITHQERHVQKSGVKVADGRNREALSHALLTFVEEKRQHELKNLINDVADMLDVPTDAAAEQVMLTSFYIDFWRGAPRDNRDFTLKFLQPELTAWLHV